MKAVLHGQSQNYAGVSFDVGQKMTPVERSRLRTVAINSGVWSYVKPANLTPTWVHFDKRRGVSSCSGGGFPLLRHGSKGAYVLVLQDALNTLGFRTNGLDGIFGNGTQNAVMAYQRARRLDIDGIVGCATWQSLVTEVVGNGRTPTTID